jgi:hypothetical protein
MEQGRCLEQAALPEPGTPPFRPDLLGRVFFFIDAPQRIEAPSHNSGACNSPNNTSAVAAISNHAMLRTTNIRIPGLLPLV